MNCEQFESQLDELLRAQAGGEASAIAAACEAHRSECEPCAALFAALSTPLESPDLVPFARAVAMSERVLPQLAQLDPGEEFTYEVLRRTRFALQRRRLRRWWRRQLERPQFAGEFAYASTLAVVLLVGTPISPGAGLPARMVEWLQGGEVPASGWLTAGATAPARLVDVSTQVSAQFGAELGSRGQTVSAVLDQLGTHGKNLAQTAWERDWDALRPLLQQIHCDMRLLWGAASGAIEDTTDELRC